MMNRQWLKALIYFRRTPILEKLTTSLFKNSIFELKVNQTMSVFQKFDDLKFRAAIRFSHYIQSKNMSTDSNDNDRNRKPPVLMDFIPVNRPRILLTLKSWILAKFIIQPYLDNDFTLKDFTIGAKQAMCQVSSFLSKGDFQSLQGLVSDDAIQEIKKNFSSLNMKERQDLLIKITDILFAFPFQIGIIFDDNNQKRFAEITVVYHCMNNFEELKNQGKIITEDSKEDIKICNYRFIREYTKGVESDWVINRLGHFKVCHFED